MVFIRGQEISSAKVRKETHRHDYSLLGMRASPEKLLEHIRVCTPPGSVQNLISDSGPLFDQQQTQISTPSPDRAVQHLVPVVTDNLPSFQLLYLLDSNGKNLATVVVETHYVTVGLLERSFANLPMFQVTSFLEDVNDVLRCCKESLRLMGYSSFDFQLSLTYNGDQHLQQLHDTLAPVGTVSTTQAGQGFIQLLKIVVPLITNSYLVPQKEPELEWLIEMLQEVNVLDRFLSLIVNYSLYWLLETLLSLDNIAVRIFAAAALGSAVFGEHHRLIRLFLKHKVSLKRTHQRNHQRGSDYSALGIALILNQDTTSVRLLLGAGADPYRIVMSNDHNLLSSIINLSDDTVLSGPAISNFRYLLTFWVAEFRPEQLCVWRFALAEALRSGSTCICGLILESLVHCVQKQLQDICVLLLHDVSECRLSSGHTIPQQPRDLELFRNDKTCQLLLSAVIGTAIATLETDDLVPFCTLKRCYSADYASNIRWAMYTSPHMDLDKIPLLCNKFDVDLSDCLEISPLYEMKKDDLSGLLRFCFKHGVTLHQGTGCLLDQVHQKYLLNEDIELFSSLLQSTDTATAEQNVCFFATLAFSGDPNLLARAIEHFETRAPPLHGARRIWEEPEILLSIIAIEEDTNMLNWLLNTRISFESFNRFLGDRLGHLPRFLRFAHPPGTLQAGLASGLRPCPSLLVMCAFACSEYAVENVRLVVEAANAQKTPFLRLDLTNCLNVMIEMISRTGKYGKYRKYSTKHPRDNRHHQCQCFNPDSIYYDLHEGTAYRLHKFRNHLSPFRYLISLGAECSDRWLEQHLFSESADVDHFKWESFISAIKPLHVAVLRRMHNMVCDLLACGLFLDEIHFCREKGCNGTALQLACSLGNSNAVDALLQAGADINFPADPLYGMTALQGAARSGHIPIILMLLRLGADVNAPAAEVEGRTALEAAAERERLDALQLLINNNPDLRLLQKDCKRASRLVHRINRTEISFMLKTRAEELAEELGLPHKDEIDSMCECQIARKTDHWCSICDPNKEARIRYFEEEYQYREIESSYTMSKVSFGDMI